MTRNDNFDPHYTRIGIDPRGALEGPVGPGREEACGYHSPRMDLSTLVKPGMQGRAELVVGEEHTAPRVGSGKVHVLATPVMINLIEAAALAALDRHLPPEHRTVPTA